MMDTLQVLIADDHPIFRRGMRALLSSSPGVEVVGSVFAALRVGARGYILKGASPIETVRAIQAVGSGEAIFSPAIAQRLIDYFADPPSPHSAIAAPLFPDLTERERDILDLIVQGFTNAEIADRLSISLKTVRNNVSNIFSKLQVADRAQAILRA